tara:strand:- start:4385 stop:4531 length:147 start_codon:yes stop_codon:yes gene_type:complete
VYVGNQTFRELILSGCHDSAGFAASEKALAMVWLFVELTAVRDFRAAV